jgi:peptidase M28-like protein
MKGFITLTAILAVGMGIMFWIFTDGFANNAAKGKAPPEPPGEERLPELYTSENDQGFGSDRVQPGQDARPVPFDGKRAMKYLQAICDIGPRMSGTKGMQKQQELVKKHFEDLGFKVTYQSFKARQNSVKGELDFTNVIVSFQPDKKRRVILCSHYDTRPIADQEPDPRDWRKPFVSANDGGSGVAMLMELAHHMKDLKTNVGVDFVLFDGEEYIWKTDGPNKDRYFIGSEHFAQTWRQTKNRCDYSAAILLDMTAGKQIRFPVEVNSYRRAPELCKEIWRIAKDQKADAFMWREGHEVQDDHLALQKVLIPAIDIIDFDYPHWHRLSDTPDACSAASFEQVAGVLSVWLQRTK